MLRTTALLGSIRELDAGAHITWIAGAASMPLLRSNPNIDRTIEYGPDALLTLQTERFDLCVNFDLAPEACALAEAAHADIKRGYGLKPNGAVRPLSPEAEQVYEMSLWDDRKRANQKTYQQLMRGILGAPDVNHPIELYPPDASWQSAKAFFQKHALGGNAPVIGFNVGAGPRWQHKKWTAAGFVKLARRVRRELGGAILILYGPDDAEQARTVMASLDTPFIDAGLWPDLLDFCALLGRCDALVTGDTFALHAALALRRPVVCLVGPTSASELEMYGLGCILQGDIDCLGCYLTRCDKDPHCMKLLEADRVFDALAPLIEASNG